MTSQPRDKTRDSTKHDTAKFGLDLYCPAYHHKLIAQNRCPRKIGYHEQQADFKVQLENRITMNYH